MKETGRGMGLAAKYSDIHMPSNTSAGFLVCVFSLVLGFAGIWHITWLGVLAFIAIVVTIAARSFSDDDGYYIPAAKVREIEEKRHRAAVAVERKLEAVEA